MIRIACLVALAIAVFCASASPARTATLKVTTKRDELTPHDGKCSLREAIDAVDAPGTATDCGKAAGSSNTIVLRALQYGLSHLVGSHLNVAATTTSLTITGAGMPVTVIDANGLGDRVLSVANGATVALRGLTITEGHAPDGGAGTKGSDNVACGMGGNGGNGSDAGTTGMGGGIYNSGNLKLTRVAVTFNYAGAGGAGGQGGDVAGIGCSGGNGANGASGGGIFNAGALTLVDSTISDNHAGAGGNGGNGFSDSGGGGNGGNGGGGGTGGGIYSTGTGATLTVTRSMISANSAGTAGRGGTGGSSMMTPGGNGGGGGAGEESGGGIANQSGKVVVTGSTIALNSAGGGGQGGDGGSGTPTNGTDGNGGDGSWGGGISSISGTLAVTNSTIYGNSAGAGGAGGAIRGSGGNGGNGGGIRVTSGASKLINATVAFNAAGSGGDAGFSGGTHGSMGAGVDLFVQSATTADEMVLKNTIIEGSFGSNCAPNTGSPFANRGHNLNFPASDTSCPAAVSGDPKLGSLQDNGGPTQTMALGGGSAAINQVPATGAGCPLTDQRGVHRPQGSTCDIGAFELAKPTIKITTPRSGASYKRGSRVLAGFRCSEGGITSPIATCNGTVADGQPINTASLGTKSFTVTATDKAGTQRSKTVHYTVTS